MSLAALNHLEKRQFEAILTQLIPFVSFPWHRLPACLVLPTLTYDSGFPLVPIYSFTLAPGTWTMEPWAGLNEAGVSQAAVFLVMLGNRLK